MVFKIHIKYWYHYSSVITFVPGLYPLPLGLPPLPNPDLSSPPDHKLPDEYRPGPRTDHNKLCTGKNILSNLHLTSEHHRIGALRKSIFYIPSFASSFNSSFHASLSVSCIRESLVQYLQKLHLAFLPMACQGGFWPQRSWIRSFCWSVWSSSSCGHLYTSLISSWMSQISSR